MSADWFCKIGEKKVGPLNGRQLKEFVAKGQLKPEHLVRQGSEGPWVSAGRVKGLFPEGATGVKSPGKKSSAAKSLPKAAKSAAPPAPEAPPANDVPQELRLGGHKHHVQMNVDSLNIDATPMSVSRRKVKMGLKGLNKQEQKKLNIILLSLIGGGFSFGLLVMIWAVASGKFSGSKPVEEATLPPGLAQAADSGKKPEKVADKRSAADNEVDYKELGVAPTPVGPAEVIVLRPILRGVPPKGATTSETEVLVMRVKVYLKPGGEKKPVELTSWASAKLKKKVTLKDKDDPKKSYEFLEQIAGKDGEVTMITTSWSIVQLLFKAPPEGKKFKELRLELPGAALHAEGADKITVGYKITPTDISDAPATSAKPEADTEKGETKTEKGAAKAEKKPAGKGKADSDSDSN